MNFYLNYYFLTYSPFRHYRNHPLFTVDENAMAIKNATRIVPPELRQQSATISSQMEKATDLPSLPTDSQLKTLDLEELYVEQNEKYQTHQRILRIRELCKVISDASYTIDDAPRVHSCVDQLEQIFKNFTAGEIISVSGSKLRYKTLRQLSRPKKFDGRDILSIAAKRQRPRRSYGDLMGLLHVNSQIQRITNEHENASGAGENSQSDKTSHLESDWVVDDIDFTDSEVLRTLDEAEMLYVSQDRKEALLQSTLSSSHTPGNCKYIFTYRRNY